VQGQVEHFKLVKLTAIHRLCRVLGRFIATGNFRCEFRLIGGGRQGQFVVGEEVEEFADAADY